MNLLKFVKKKLKLFLPLAFIGLGITLFLTLSQHQSNVKKKTEIVSVPTVLVDVVSLENFTLNVESFGIASAKNSTEISTQIDGQIIEIKDNFYAGGFVKKGDVLAIVDSSDYKTALIEAEANLASALASLEQEKAQGEVVKHEWQNAKNRTGSPSALSLRKPQLDQELASVKYSEAQMMKAKRNLERTKIRAPYDGIIEKRKINIGTYVRIGENIGKINDTSTAEVRIPITDKDFKYLSQGGIGATVRLTGSALGHKVDWVGKINNDERVVDHKTRMTYLVAHVNDPYNISGHSDKLALRFGTYLTVTVSGKTLPQVSKVKSSLIKDNSLALLDSESRLQYREINVEKVIGEYTIVSGLFNGDKVVISPLGLYDVNTLFTYQIVENNTQLALHKLAGE